MTLETINIYIPIFYTVCGIISSYLLARYKDKKAKDIPDANLSQFVSSLSIYADPTPYLRQKNCVEPFNKKMRWKYKYPAISLFLISVILILFQIIMNNIIGFHISILSSIPNN